MENTISRIIADLHQKYHPCLEGKLADYIPELTKADPNWFGISLFTADGREYSVGDAAQPFTIQSVSKAFTYGMVLDEHGVDKVQCRIGVEPSGEAFNSISLDPNTGRPFNPMINAGAITASGMVGGSGIEQRFEKIRQRFSQFAGNELGVDEEVYRSESATGFRNRAIANLLRNFEMLDDPVDEAVEVYFKQCSVLVTCKELALMGACLANGGVNPVTGERVLKAENIERVLSVMSTCGMYDYSGEWVVDVGLPAKSGVGGGVVGVLPGQIGVAVFSPLLDAKGNSVRGLRVFAELSRLFNLHLFNYPTISEYMIRRVYTLSAVGSHRQRIKKHHDAIREHGQKVAVVEMQGDLFFAALERLTRVIEMHAETTATFVLDLRRVGGIDPATVDLLLNVSVDVKAAGKQLLIVDPSGVLERVRFETASDGAVFVDDIELALEFCEERIIAEQVEAPRVSGLVPFYEFDVFNSLTSAELSELEGQLEMEQFQANTRIIKQGAEPDMLYLLCQGSVSICLRPNGSDDQRGSRVAAFGSGVCFGEIAVIDGSLRSADVWADEPSTCYTLSAADLEKLERENATIYAKIIKNVLLLNIDRLRRFNREISSLKS